MTRAHVSYAERRPIPRTFVGTNVSEPTAGYYRGRLRSGAVRVGIRVWFGPPLDPVTGEEMDRSWRWQAQANGEYVDLDHVWPVCAGEPISEAEYRALVARSEWAKQHAPDSSYADPRRKRDLLSRSEPLPF